jgi:hypothetical protein
MFALAGENLTKRLRSSAFRAMLSQEVAWFDEPENNVGSLCTRLSVEAGAVQGVMLMFFPLLTGTLDLYLY